MLKRSAPLFAVIVLSIACGDTQYRSEVAGPCERTTDAGYVRTTSSATGATSWWHASDAQCIPLGLEPTPCNDARCQGAEETTLTAALDTWNGALDDAGTDVCVAYSGPQDARWLGHAPGEENRNVVAFTADRNLFVDRHPMSPNVIALTTSSLQVTDARIVGADIEINDGLYTFSCQDAPVRNHLDLYSVLLHEVGHLLGFDHTGTRDSVMYPTEDLGAPTRRELSSSDRAGLQETFGCY